MMATSFMMTSIEMMLNFQAYNSYQNLMSKEKSAAYWFLDFICHLDFELWI
jgi:hypothetical protein